MTDERPPSPVPAAPPPPPPMPMSAPAPSRSPPPPAAGPPPLQSHLPSSLSLGLVPLHTPPRAPPPPPEPAAEHAPPPLARVRLADIAPYEGAPGGAHQRAVEALSASLTRHNAAVIELGAEDAVVVRCALESARMYFRARARGRRRLGEARPRGLHIPRREVFRRWRLVTPLSLGKAARAALCAIARHLRLRSDVFNHLLDDTPLPVNEFSSSVLVASYSHGSLQNGKGPVAGAKPSSTEVEKGLLTLIASDYPGVQVCDPNGRWYLADGGDSPGDLLLLTGKALSHATAGLRPATSYRTVADHLPLCMTSGRASLTFRLVPQANAILDCSPISAAGHVIPQSYQPISVSQFMDDLSAEEDVICNHPENTYEAQNNLIREPSLRSVLSDPLSGAFLEDAMVVSCGHSFGGHMLKQVIDKARCSLCHAEIEADSLIPNYALRAAAVAVKMEDDRRLFHNAALRKRRKEAGEHMDALKRLSKENGEVAADADSHRQLKGVQYPFAVSEKVLIKGNRRTPDNFVGREAVITSQCLNGWYLLKILDTGESVRLQYRSLQKLSGLQSVERSQPQPLLQTSS
ncbi:U-box domain-containing protein 62 [Ananas comosus]|uniref:U-box domain-containing protein 62 n=1 Tax=Ananas comosus TaxID=4615 RepID=A0A199VDJ8_ANACO|nr:U-box domain-containing protein 62 [Ananas comosus]